jgi:hypothetical protein
MDDKKLFALINILYEKTESGLIQWSVSGTSDSDWGTLIDPFWVVISNREPSGITFQVLKNSEIYINICTAQCTLSKLYNLVKDKVSPENKVIDQLIQKLEKVQPYYNGKD